MVKQAQSGRSMLEMMGVLAVMGVLSIVALRGYHNTPVERRSRAKSQCRKCVALYHRQKCGRQLYRAI